MKKLRKLCNFVLMVAKRKKTSDDGDVLTPQQIKERKEEENNKNPLYKMPFEKLIKKASETKIKK